MIASRFKETRNNDLCLCLGSGSYTSSYTHPWPLIDGPLLYSTSWPAPRSGTLSSTVTQFDRQLAFALDAYSRAIRSASRSFSSDASAVPCAGGDHALAGAD